MDLYFLGGPGSRASDATLRCTRPSRFHKIAPRARLRAETPQEEGCVSYIIWHARHFSHTYLYIANDTLIMIIKTH